MMVNGSVISIKLATGGSIEHYKGIYVQAVLDEDVKKKFWEDFDEVVRGRSVLCRVDLLFY